MPLLRRDSSLVSSLLYLPPPPSAPTADSRNPGAYLLSAGGDSTIQLFRLPSAELVKQVPIADLILPHIIVCAQRPVPIPAGRRKDKRGERKNKEQGAGDAAQPKSDGEEGTAETDNATTTPRQFSDLPKAMAVTKMLEIGTTRENGGVIVLVAGSTALLYIPFRTLFADSTATDVAPPSLLAFSHPILDVVGTPVPSAAGSLCEVLVSFDTTRGPGSPDSAPLTRVSLRSEDSSLVALPTLATDAVFFESACATTDSPPAVSSLYPVLSLLHHPGEVGDEADPEAAAKDKRNRGKKRGWTTDPDALSESGDGIRPGKRAAGRAETLQRYEEAKRKLASGGADAPLTEGEKAAVQAIEAEAQNEASAVVEGSTVA